jgi:hypothetical protein
MEMDMTNAVANTILAQLGGRKFLAMTGASSLTGSADSLSMRLPTKSCKNRVGGVRITLDATDTYTMVAFKLVRKQGLLDVAECYKVSGIYCDQLAECFTEATGLYTSL